jgi:acyl-CoA reductase-like NAD-dependent aldehyde dehydrogenase
VTSASTEEPIGSVPEGAESDVDAAVAAARRAFDDPHGWSQWEPSARAAAIGRLATELEARSAEMAQRVSAQNGMPISIAAMLEGGFPVVVLRYIAGLLDGASIEEERLGFLGGTNIVRREPIGVVGAIVPWNYPQTLAAFKYAPALAAGCTIVMKPSPETVLDAFLLAEAIAAAGIPDGAIVLHAGERYMELAERWDHSGQPFTREDDVRLFAALQQAGQLTARAVEIIFAAAGSSAAKRGTRLQRYYRDVAMYQGHIAAQHLSTAGDLARVHFGLPDSLF